MSTKPFVQSERERRYRALLAAVESGYPAPGEASGKERGAISVAARALNVPHGTLSSWWTREAHLFPPLPSRAPAEDADIAAIPRPEIRDASFWRRKAETLQRDLDHAELLAEQLAGLRNSEAQKITWASRPTKGKGASVVGMLLSDVHMGEVIRADEISGLNAFDPDICERRVKRYFEAACHVGARLSSDTDCRGALLVLGGDLISGDIHEELRVTNALTSHEQVLRVVGMLGAAIRLMRKAFDRVHVVSVPGNHGRTTHKPTMKLVSRSNYDTLIAAMLADQMRGESNISFQYGPDKDQFVNLFGFEHMITHGDRIGSRGGTGYIGPVANIIKGAKKIEVQQASVGRKPDYIWHGHFHTTSNAGNVLSNGSVAGYSEFASDLRASVEPPQQWLAICHSHWGIRERVPIQLEDPQREKPRVSVRAA